MLMLHSFQSNITEIRTDALKLLTMFKRPVPRAAATIGAWVNIFQVLKKFRPKMCYLYIYSKRPPHCFLWCFPFFKSCTLNVTLASNLIKVVYIYCVLMVLLSIQKISVSDSDVNMHKLCTSSMAVWSGGKMENRTWTRSNSCDGACPPYDQVWILALCSWGNVQLYSLSKAFCNS